MADHILYSEIDRSFWYYQPNLTRWRHALRSPRRSLRINQETMQTAWDIRRIYDIDAQTNTDLTSFSDHLLEGWDFESSVDFNWEDDATPSDAAAYLISLEELTTRIERLRSKVKDMEN